MAPDSKSAPLQHQEEEEQQPEDLDTLSHNPSAPPDELFDISTTVDPSYVISLIRKLLPANGSNNPNYRGDVSCGPVQGLNVDDMEKSALTRSGVPPPSTDTSESMEINDDFNENATHEGESEAEQPRHSVPVGEEAWEEYGCILWDLSASKTHAELMNINISVQVQNLVLEVLLANLMVSQSVRTTEIGLGIIGNLACHEVPMKHIVSTNGLIEFIVDQMFLDDAQCLCEVCRLLTVGLQSSEGVTWAEALQSEHYLTHILWIAENSLNTQLIEKSAELLLAIIESSQDVMHILLPPLMKLGLASLLINLLDIETSKLMSERAPERYPILDVVLRAIEALSVIDDHSQDICLDKDLFQLVCALLKFPDKVEVANSCVTAVVLVANILSDVPTLASELSHDMLFLQGLLDVFPFTSDDSEARSALWNIIARLLVRLPENEMSSSTIQQYVLVLVSKSDVIEDDLLDCQLGGLGLKARTTALRRIISILNQWTASKDYAKENENNINIDRLLDCCCKHSEDVPSTVSHDMDLKE
ncbi:uncharacterized protein LOC112167999 isoform X1 [Rosa chinensis]|uniref:uncharacterized protein LOC112167999 isoform X1 n=1 Tax=Rosa chinensis TaxID=74649 RepID=UPI001AD8C163|nr:uncharacterized protein LOC112167999 isoform X1 [Rosa chinensis]